MHASYARWESVHDPPSTSSRFSPNVAFSTGAARINTAPPSLHRRCSSSWLGRRGRRNGSWTWGGSSECRRNCLNRRSTPCWTGRHRGRRRCRSRLGRHHRGPARLSHSRSSRVGSCGSRSRRHRPYHLAAWKSLRTRRCRRHRGIRVPHRWHRAVRRGSQGGRHRPQVRRRALSMPHLPRPDSQSKHQHRIVGQHARAQQPR